MQLKSSTLEYRNDRWLQTYIVCCNSEYSFYATIYRSVVNMNTIHLPFRQCSLKITFCLLTFNGTYSNKIQWNEILHWISRRKLKYIVWYKINIIRTVQNYSVKIRTIRILYNIIYHMYVADTRRTCFWQMVHNWYTSSSESRCASSFSSLVLNALFTIIIKRYSQHEPPDPSNHPFPAIL